MFREDLLKYQNQRTVAARHGAATEPCKVDDQML